MTTTENFRDPNLSDDEQDAIIGAFVRQREDAKLRARWEKKLASEQQLSRKEKPVVRTMGKIRRLSFLLVGVAAALLFLVVFLPGLMVQNGEELLAENITELSLSGTRGATQATTPDDLRSQLLNNFQAGDFASAALAGERLMDLPEASEADRLNLGLAYLRAKRYEAAAGAFRRLVEGGSIFRSEARYYLGLSLLAGGDTPAGLEQMRQITPADGGRIYDNAKELLGADWE